MTVLYWLPEIEAGARVHRLVFLSILVATLIFILNAIFAPDYEIKIQNQQVKVYEGGNWKQLSPNVEAYVIAQYFRQNLSKAILAITIVLTTFIVCTSRIRKS